MRSSTGAHFIGLDHVRALAIFMVFVWHFTHAATGYPVPFGFTPAIFPLALLDEGHVGVALFMTLSGYLFAKLLDGRQIRYFGFLLNRVLRLVPLLLAVILYVGWSNLHDAAGWYAYGKSILRGLLYPELPNGGWSITVEFHFYVILPLLLWMLRRSRLLLLLVLAAAIALRLYLRHHYGEVQTLAYWTLVGRIDQFVLGILAYHLRALITRRHLAALAVFLGFSGVYWLFDRQGGFYNRPSYPSPSLLWTVLPTIEGLGFASLIAWYDTSFVHATTGLSKLVGRIGAYSYSTYLLHFFYVFQAARWVDEHVMAISNFYLATLWTLALLVLVTPIGWLSFALIESPFLRLRVRYVVDEAAAAVPEPARSPRHRRAGRRIADGSRT